MRAGRSLAVLVAVSLLDMVRGSALQAPTSLQFVPITAPVPGINGCNLVTTAADLRARLTQLQGIAGGMPSVDFTKQDALVVTTFDRNGVPNQLGPSAANPKVLVLSFTRAAAPSNSGVFVFAVDKAYGGRFTGGCQVAYAPPVSRPTSSVIIK